MKPTRYISIGDLFLTLAPSYASRSWKPFYVTFPYDPSTANFLRKLNPTRFDKRRREYVDPKEIERSKGTFRFGVKKSGRGFQKERGDFCLIGGHLDGKHLHLFYRRIEIVGGLHFDLSVIEAVRKKFEIRRVTIFATHAFQFGVKGRLSLSKERLYKSLVNFYRGVAC